MITEDYVSFETAKLLKEKRFDVSVRTSIERVYLDRDDTEMIFHLDADNWNAYSTKHRFSCPTIQMACKWLREVHKIHVVIYPYGNYSCDNYQFDVYKDNKLVVSKDDGYITYEEACEAAIKYCLENLI